MVTTYSTITANNDNKPIYLEDEDHGFALRRTAAIPH